MERGDELTELIVGSAWLMRVLGIVAELGLPDCWVGAGAVRDLVWDTRFAPGPAADSDTDTAFDPANVSDVDVVFFDPDDLSAERERAIERRLFDREPTLDWDVKNQARVHLWYEARFGSAVEPLTSTTEGVSTWPEIATAVAVRLSPGGKLEIAAPYGLDDLLDGIWRRNPVRVSGLEYRARIERKQPHSRWPGVVVVDGPIPP